MKRILTLAGVAFLAGSLSAIAADTNPSTSPTSTHTVDSMTSGYHAMSKHTFMSNKEMPSRNPHCSEAALANMPADHRVACGKMEGATVASTPTHSADSMTAGSHMMAGQKNMQMSNKLMPSHNQSCSEEALEKMPADHRAACGK